MALQYKNCVKLIMVKIQKPIINAVMLHQFKNLLGHPQCPKKTTHTVTHTHTVRGPCPISCYNRPTAPFKKKKKTWPVTATHTHTHTHTHHCGALGTMGGSDSPARLGSFAKFYRSAVLCFWWLLHNIERRRLKDPLKIRLKTMKTIILNDK